MFKKIILRLFTYIAILHIIDKFIYGFELDSITTLIIFSLIMSICQTALTPLIKFLTLPINFFTFGLFNGLLSCALLYVFDLLIGGFTIMDGYLDPLSTDLIQVPKITLSKIGVIILSAFLIAFFNNIVNWTQESK